MLSNTFDCKRGNGSVLGTDDVTNSKSKAIGNKGTELRGFTNATQGNGNLANQFSAAGAAGGAAVGVNLLNFFIGGILVNANIAGDATASSYNGNTPEMINEG
ncbi:hypothetical protein [Bacillus sp. B1-b2]|uniref:hypothetical protein n=1 Tax=Bacillus sp. B1-b2 TaxID=2653201 RepID=UPI001261DF23|nr:hypothetical protein [Bacillus sp. B1-b2]KAB7668735.1 hypothetical protein F9279_12975 [Bacillus sp. B1-b2]